MGSLLSRIIKQRRELAPAVAPPPNPDPDAPCGWEPGHFYSPIPSLKEVRANEAEIFDRRLRELPGIDLNPAGQLELLRRFIDYFGEFPFSSEKNPKFRFHSDNPNFGPGEALILTSWIRHFRPKRIIEVGSGYSSCAILDLVDLYLDGRCRCSFVEPFPDLLLSLLRPEDRSRIEVVPRRAQDIEPSLVCGVGGRRRALH